MSSYVVIDVPSPAVDPSCIPPVPLAVPQPDQSSALLVPSPRKADNHLAGREVVQYSPEQVSYSVQDVVRPGCSPCSCLIALWGSIALTAGVALDILCNVDNLVYYTHCPDTGRIVGWVVTGLGSAGLLVSTIGYWPKVASSIERLCGRICSSR